MKNTELDQSQDQEDIASGDEQEKVGDLPLNKQPVRKESIESNSAQTKNISAFFGTEKYPAEYYFKETQRYIRQGQHRKAFIILDKFYERNKNEQFSESVLMKLGRRYLTCGIAILRQYQQREEIHQKSQTMILLKKLSTMIILWYQSLIKILDKNRCYNDEFIVPEINTDYNTPNPQTNQSQNYPQQSQNSKKVGLSSFSNMVNKLEKQKKEELKQQFKYPELSLEMMMTDLIEPSMINLIPDDVQIAKNLIDFWSLFIELLVMWSIYYKKMQDAWASYKFMSKAEKLIEQKQVYTTENIQLLKVSSQVRMHQAQIIMELGLFPDAIALYEEALQIQQRMLNQQISAKNFLPKNAKEIYINLANQKIEKTVCLMCVGLLVMHQAYEQLDKIEQGMECLRLLYWLIITFIKQQQYSDLLNESYKSYQLFTSKYDELMNMNAEINKIFSIALNRGQKYMFSTNDDQKNVNEDFLDFVNQYLYKKSKAEELNETLVIIQKKPIIDNLFKQSIGGQSSIDIGKNEMAKDQIYYSLKSNHSITSQNKLSKINESKETYFTEQNTTTMKGTENKTDESMTQSTTNNNLNNFTNISKKDYYLNRTYQNNTVTSEALLTLNEESPEKTFQQHRIQVITSSFLHPLNQTENKSSTNLMMGGKSAQILSQSSLGRLPQTTKSERKNSIKFNLIKSVAAFEKVKQKEGHQVNWDKLQKSKKKVIDIQKIQQKEEYLQKYQPKLVSSNKFFFEKQIEHETDATNLRNNKELEVDKIFGVHKKKKYNILDHDVDTFADNIIARQILLKSNCMPYNHIRVATEQNLNDYYQEKNEFGFCRKVLHLKKQGMSSTLTEKEKDFNIHDANNEMIREASDVQTTLLLNNEIQDKKKQLEETKRIKSLNLDLIPHQKDENTASKFKKILYNHSKKLGLNLVKRNLKQITNHQQKSQDQQQTQRSLKNLLFAEEEEQLDEQGKLKKTQNINKETIKLHLTELDYLIQNAHDEISQGHKKKFNRTISDFNDLNSQQQNQTRAHDLTIGEKIAKDYARLSASTKYYVAKSSGQKINSFFDLVNSKMRLGKIQKEEEQKIRMGTPIMKKTLNEAVRRASIMRQTLIMNKN
ncbi:hypothetical protein TTHERM_00241780 (macronuclear) [Tetrahymena thermophila SB210]|uniref:Tetratricopeptide repeat protein n=1 Tax=Tetrahymena thermophila (strain SB210) TaxID=312017 RepID=I7MMD7_TETTS|nr:hypothetical protein TTHERM_00241780 [Tetrahymena thermophila SB210]EAS04657.2 hypothetical protein TTHERM_00241780 [Tetrahymena thermophila SB210]|eukprot:XP_001024902.2 hypothetical protein TTHERM_00241780 [Tetrahymena thermophila SB210]